MVVDICGVRQGVSKSLQAVCTRPLGISCGFASISNLNFGFPNLRERGYGGWPSWYGIRWGVSDFLYRLHYKAFKCLLSQQILRALSPRLV